MMDILVRVASLAIGYVCGLFETGYIYSKSMGVDIHQKGSGNVGMTNTMRVMGLKAGIITLAGDMFKTIFAVVITFFIFRGGAYHYCVHLLMFYAGFGAILGHNFPVYMHFKGGKGVACTAGVIASAVPLTIPICLGTFIVTLVITKYVSLGSVLVFIVLFLQNVIFGQLGWMGLSGEPLYEFYVVSFLLSALGIWRHRENIKRLINGTESKVSVGHGEEEAKEAKKHAQEHTQEQQ